MSSDASQNELLFEISQKLDLILALLAVRGLEDNQSAIVKKLYEMGMSAKIIAPVAGMSENAVNIRLTRMRKGAVVKPSKRRVSS